MLNKIYEIIKNNPNKWNSINIANMLVCTPSEVRVMITEINKDVINFDRGIVSSKGKYKLAEIGEDFKNKVLYYRALHKHATEMEQLWLQRQDIVTGRESAQENDFSSLFKEIDDKVFDTAPGEKIYLKVGDKNE